MPKLLSCRFTTSGSSLNTRTQTLLAHPLPPDTNHEGVENKEIYDGEGWVLGWLLGWLGWLGWLGEGG